MIIKPTGGLCNYLRVVFSYYSKAIHENTQLLVIWESTDACPGYFLDYFKPINNITFINYNDKYHVDYTGCEIHKDFPPNYSALQLKDSIASLIKKKKEILGPYIAVHIRRTDHIASAKKNNCFTTDEDFFMYIDKMKENKSIYIATDNIQTFTLFKTKYKNSIPFGYHTIKPRNLLRHTSLLDAITDLFMCIYADDFMGSGRSSFTDFIYTIRNDRCTIR